MIGIWLFWNNPGIGNRMKNGWGRYLFPILLPYRNITRYIQLFLENDTDKLNALFIYDSTDRLRFLMYFFAEFSVFRYTPKVFLESSEWNWEQSKRYFENYFFSKQHSVSFPFTFTDWYHRRYLPMISTIL